MKLLENDRLRIEVCPKAGGKIVSFYSKMKDFELAAQTKKKPDELPSVKGCFAPYAFGMDDAFPNINEENIEWKGRKLAYPDHGEIWSAQFEVLNETDKHVSMCWKSSRMGYRYWKTMRITGNTLLVHYYIVNEKTEELPCLWTWHGLMRYEEDMEIILPQDTESCRNVLTGPVLGRAGTVYSLNNGKVDFSKVPEAKSRSMSKFYVDHPVKQGCCGFYYPGRNVTCMLEYDKDKLPYLGVWVTAGGFQGDYNCALEPANGYYDSISTAQKNGRLPVLKMGESMEFELKITLK